LPTVTGASHTCVVDAGAGKQSDRLVGIEGMRAIAACSILVFHATQLFTAGNVAVFGVLAVAGKPLWLGVTCFFVLSGFLLYRPFAAAIMSGAPLPSVRRYFRHRVLRIVPAYWVILVVVGFVLGAACVDPMTAHTGFFTGHLHLFVLDALLLQEYSPSTIATGIMPAWSLAAEAVFYVLLPLLAVAAYRTARRADDHRTRLVMALLPAATLEAIGVAGHIMDSYLFPGPIGSFTAGWHSVIDRGFLGQADGFAWGMFVAVLVCEYRAGRISIPTRRQRLVLEAVLVLGAFAMLMLARPLATLAFPAPFALLLGYIALHQVHQGQTPPVLIRVLGSRPLVAAGLGSYSVFLWNLPIYTTMTRFGIVFPGYSGFPLTLAILAILTGACSYVTYRFVEAPTIRIARRRRPTAAAAPTPIEASAPATAG
jgi:peptidoglycan/LPS O-acetylase OafA/YrhL